MPTIESKNKKQNLIGLHIKQLRISQKRTVQDLADQSELSKSMISKIENNKALPSIAALVKIASALGVKVSDLMEANATISSEMTLAKEVQGNLSQTKKGYMIFPFAPNVRNKKMQPFIFTAVKGEVKRHSLTHDGEEFLYVLEGSLKIKVGDVEYLLNVGDSLYFNSLEPHGIMPESDYVMYLDIFV
ncbi:helix-turn-helix domain-containing protein [Maribacter sp. LLG6340-A2]|uniref:helix-turn-helix domain-containing protein n=1 Tax=Maribacter sp. LLG6340-A2 TaxID=3160834 RepID=UPI0038635CCE